MDKLTIVINAGGQSRRMGTAKALLPVPPHRRPLIAHIAAQLAPLDASRLVVVTNDTQLPALAQLPPDTIFLPDAYPDTGTLGGIATGLQQAPAWSIVVACDLPLVRANLFAALLELAADQEAGADRWDAIVPVVDGYEQPLHALYHRRCLPAVEAHLAAGHLRVISFMPDVRTRYVQEPELRLLDPQLRSFLNTNTPEEWAEAMRLLADQ